MRLLLAHQGGWDELLLVLTPVSLFAGLLALANRRANAQLRDRRPPPDDDPPESPDATP
ncbi:MAG TPA: hypothetical protein VEW93_05815 [Acidimicrobiales bacterium]|nr:hypothetical protein [Acidimicrobiales bacterium]